MFQANTDSAKEVIVVTKRKKMHKKVQTKTLRHEGKTYHRDSRGNYQDDDGDILPVLILTSILSGSGTNDVEAGVPHDDFEGHGGHFGGGGASESFDSGSDSGGSDGGGGGD